MKKITEKEIAAAHKAITEIAAGIKADKKKQHLPPEAPTGTCVVCCGPVIGAHEAVYSDRIGDTSPPSWRFLGYHCQDCGLMYHFPTKDWE